METRAYFLKLLFSSSFTQMHHSGITRHQSQVVFVCNSISPFYNMVLLSPHGIALYIWLSSLIIISLGRLTTPASTLVEHWESCLRALGRLSRVSHFLKDSHRVLVLLGSIHHCFYFERVKRPAPLSLHSLLYSKLHSYLTGLLWVLNYSWVYYITLP